ncbi:hypothetical protein ACIP4Y_12775 [Streptomyces sp. NPDC088810]|uniref:hypothetical protein n=1 Tax=Streptomyces sp. NPDC088810 TaxID=3365904 RepID=UPI0037F82793
MTALRLDDKISFAFDSAIAQIKETNGMLGGIVLSDGEWRLAERRRCHANQAECPDAAQAGQTAG